MYRYVVLRFVVGQDQQHRSQRSHRKGNQRDNKEWEPSPEQERQWLLTHLMMRLHKGIHTLIKFNSCMTQSRSNWSLPRRHLTLLCSEYENVFHATYCKPHGKTGDLQLRYSNLTPTNGPVFGSCSLIALFYSLSSDHRHPPTTKETVEFHKV